MAGQKFLWNCNRINQQREKLESLLIDFDEILHDNLLVQNLFDEANGNFNKDKLSPTKLSIIFYDNNKAEYIEFLHELRLNFINEQIEINIDNDPLTIIFEFLFGLCDCNNIAKIKFENYKNDQDSDNFTLAREKIQYQENLAFVKTILTIFLQNSKSISNKIQNLTKPTYHYDSFEQYLENNKLHTESYKNIWQYEIDHLDNFKSFKLIFEHTTLGKNDDCISNCNLQ